MKIDFCGVGEAFDEHHTNTSILATLPGRPLHQVLLDCGFSAPSPFWRISPDPLALDAVWISHFHGDHFLGLPQLLLRMFESNRQKPFTVIGQKGVRELVVNALELAYPGILQKMAFTIEAVEVNAGQTFEASGFKGAVAPSIHSIPCLALRLESESGSVFYSGDGRPSEDSRRLAKGCDLIIQETFTIDEPLPGHAAITEAIAFAKKADARYLALIHLNRKIRCEKTDQVKALLGRSDGLATVLPESGDTLDLAQT